MNMTFKEIGAQFDSLEKTIGLFEKEREKAVSFFQKIKPKRILFTGCGSSYYLSCSLRTIASMRMDLPVYALASGDLWLNCGSCRHMLEDALVVAVSRSGKTSESIKAFQAVKELHCRAHFLSVICAENTPLGEISDMVLAIPWAFDESICQTRSVTNLYAAGAMYIGAWSGDDDIRKGLRRMAEIGPGYLKKIDPLAHEIASADWDHVVVLADGEGDGLAEEGALAYKEISQINSNYHHLLDVRHGPMVLIGGKTLVLASVKAPAEPYEMALIDDLLKRGARVVCYSQKDLGREDVSCVSLGESVGPVAGGLGLIVLCQLVSYHKSGFVGCNPDQPDGLDAWIKIE